MRRWPPISPPTRAELLLKVRDEVGFERPVGARRRGRQSCQRADCCAGCAPSGRAMRCSARKPHDDLVRLTSDRVWIIDPVDGTREFSTPGRDDWAVHIALWQRQPTASPMATRNHRRRSRFASARKHRLPQRHRDRTGAAIHGVPQPLRIAVSANRPPCGAVPDAPDAAHPTGGDRLGGRQSDGDHRRRRRRLLHAGGQWEWDSAAPAGVVHGRRACTRRGWTAHRCATTSPTRICPTS